MRKADLEGFVFGLVGAALVVDAGLDVVGTAQLEYSMRVQVRWSWQKTQAWILASLSVDVGVKANPDRGEIHLDLEVI